MSTAVQRPTTLEDFLGPELAEMVRAIVRGVRQRARDEGATEDEVRLAGITAGNQWTDALLDETLFDFGPVNKATGDAPRDWKPFEGLPGYDEHLKKFAIAQFKATAAPSNPEPKQEVPRWQPIEREAAEPPAGHLELARQIQQLKLGAS